jgi:glyoxylase-like metal-dependent hydrolase (beta-lactamase superfamily II)
MMAEERAPVRAKLVANQGWDERLHVFRAGQEVDTTALITQRFLVVIDTMGTPELATEIMQSLQRVRQGRHLLAINTHAHWDHCWGNSIFADVENRFAAPIIGHAKTRRHLQSQEARDTLARKQAEDARFNTVKLAPPTITFSETLCLDGGDLTLELVPTPGHADDHVVVWIPKIRLLLAGDAAEFPFPSVSHAHDLSILRASLERLMALDPVMVIPCHGGTTEPDLPQRNLAYFDEVARRCHAALDTGALPPGWAQDANLPDVVGFAYADALRFAGADPAKTPAFYRSFHHDAVRVTMESLTAM